jgi:6,7-dimethyl-8-ribityllumazine synthase
MSLFRPEPANIKLPPSATIGVVASRFNSDIVEALLTGCTERLKELGADESRIDVRRVPGAFELPVAAKLMAQTQLYSAIICIGCVIRGETAHFDYVAGAAAQGVLRVGIDTGVPCIFGVLTVDSLEQAKDRTGGSHGHAGVSAADAAAEMIDLAMKLRR